MSTILVAVLLGLFIGVVGGALVGGIYLWWEGR